MRALLLAAATVGHAAAQSNSIACNIDYTDAYMATMTQGVVVGSCSPTTIDGRRRSCLPECQEKIDAVIAHCPDKQYTQTDPKTGLNITQNFLWRAIETLSTFGPDDCDYHVGFTGCSAQCNLATVTRVFNNELSDNNGHRCIDIDPESKEGLPEAVWHNCEGVCDQKFRVFNRECSNCRDAKLQHFLDDAGRKLVRCGTAGNKGCAALWPVLDSACCAGGACNISQQKYPVTCKNRPVCAAAVQTGGIRCPHIFIEDARMLGLFETCGGRLEQLLAAKPIETAQAQYCDADASNAIIDPNEGSEDPRGRRLAAADAVEELFAYFNDNPANRPVTVAPISRVPDPVVARRRAQTSGQQLVRCCVCIKPTIQS